MNGVFLVLAVTSAVSAEPLPGVRFARPGDKPVGNATSERDCPEGGAGVIVAGTRTIGPARITLLHECGMGDEGSVMSIRIGDAYFDADVMLIHYTGANMTEAPERRSLVSDRVFAGTLADRSPAVVQAVTTHARFVDNRTDKLEREEWGVRVQVCSLTPAPACVNAGNFFCPPGGCPVPTLARGTLRVVAKDSVLDKAVRARTFEVVLDAASEQIP